MIERVSKSILFATVLSKLYGCVSPSTTHSQMMTAPFDVPETAGTTEYLPNQELEVVLSYADHWPEGVDYVAPQSEPIVSGFECAEIALAWPEPGPWRLVGVSPVYYTPILDIYTDRTDLSAKSGPAYYHFRFTHDAK